MDGRLDATDDTPGRPPSSGRPGVPSGWNLLLALLARERGYCPPSATCCLLEIAWRSGVVVRLRPPSSQVRPAQARVGSSSSGGIGLSASSRARLRTASIIEAVSLPVNVF